MNYSKKQIEIMCTIISEYYYHIENLRKIDNFNDARVWLKIIKDYHYLGNSKKNGSGLWALNILDKPRFEEDNSFRESIYRKLVNIRNKYPMFEPAIKDAEIAGNKYFDYMYKRVLSCGYCDGKEIIGRFSSLISYMCAGYCIQYTRILHEVGDMRKILDFVGGDISTYKSKRIIELFSNYVNADKQHKSQARMIISYYYDLCYFYKCLLGDKEKKGTLLWILKNAKLLSEKFKTDSDEENKIIKNNLDTSEIVLTGMLKVVDNDLAYIKKKLVRRSIDLKPSMYNSSNAYTIAKYFGLTLYYSFEIKSKYFFSTKHAYNQVLKASVATNELNDEDLAQFSIFNKK